MNRKSTTPIYLVWDKKRLARVCRTLLTAEQYIEFIIENKLTEQKNIDISKSYIQEEKA